MEMEEGWLSTQPSFHLGLSYWITPLHFPQNPLIIIIFYGLHSTIISLSTRRGYYRHLIIIFKSFTVNFNSMQGQMPQIHPGIKFLLGPMDSRHVYNVVVGALTFLNWSRLRTGPPQCLQCVSRNSVLEYYRECC